MTLRIFQVIFFSSGFFDELIDEVLQEQETAAANVQDAFDDEDITDHFTNTARKVVNSYLGEALVRSDSDPLDYWRIKENEFPILAQVWS